MTCLDMSFTPIITRPGGLKYELKLVFSFSMQTYQNQKCYYFIFYSLFCKLMGTKPKGYSLFCLRVVYIHIVYTYIYIHTTIHAATYYTFNFRSEKLFCISTEELFFQTMLQKLSCCPDGFRFISKRFLHCYGFFYHFVQERGEHRHWL